MDLSASCYVKMREFQKGQLLKILRTACVLFVLLFSDFFSGSTYSDNLQPFDRSIATSMAVNKTEPKVRSINSLDQRVQRY